MEKQKQFITDAGHELRTPITSITTSADIAAMEYGDDEWIRNIQDQAERLADLTNDLVALSRLDEEAPQLEKVEFDLSDAARETAESFGPRAKAEGKTYTIEIEDADDLSQYGLDEPECTISIKDDDGDTCTAKIDGNVKCTVERSQVVDLVEAVNGIIL